MDVPKGALSVRLTDRGRKRLERLQRARDSSYSQVINDALIHMLATYERRQEIFSYVPSEQTEADSPSEPETDER